MREISYTVPAEFDGVQAQVFLKSRGISRRVLTALKRSGGLTRGGGILRTVDAVHAGEVITLQLDGGETSVAANPELSADIVYEDVVVFNKPPFMPVHPSQRHHDDTLANLFAARYPGLPFRPINRLDRNTTGVVLFSLDKQTQPAFDQMVIDHAFEKHYLALAEGKIDWNEKLIDKPIARDRHDSRKMRVGASGKPSQTRVKVLKRLKSRRGLPTRSYIDVELLTGRKHQIRVHLASEHHPLVGDDLYGTPRPCGLMLHAHSVSFTHIHIEAPCPWEP